MAAITVTCTECNASFKTSAEVQGKKVRCKSCGGVFVARAAAPAAAGKGVTTKPGAKPAAKPVKKEVAKTKPPVEEVDTDDDGNPYGLTETDLTPRCPHCANELESADAKVCLHCGYNTETRQQVKLRKVVDQTSGDFFLHLLPGILCVLAIIFMAVWDVLYCLRIDGWVESQDEHWYFDLMGSAAVKMWMCITTDFIGWMLGKSAIRRLILERAPPEIEKK